ncbi:MAG: TonB-dependent receptor [Prevotella sp.]|nr:TonB-dependent receptor [Prevotella sp.]MBR1557558.1 TonB-dependent receptor [Prevotella sp.]
MKRICLTLASLFLFVGLALAQTKVTGSVVTYEDNEPIIGATIQVVGDKSVGAITDYNGNFAIDVPAGRKTLRITYIGMEPLDVAVSTKPLRIQLRSDANTLDEVVVVAYGTQKKTSLTGSIQEVKSESIDLRPTSSVASALEGTVSGVQVNSTYGSPGSDPSIRIRGVGTVNGDSSPLYVIDGVPYSGNISDLNPQDIESMSVLKDAASAALYGNRASNGVILITTKKGKQGRLNVSFDLKQGTYSRGIPEYDRLGVRDWMEMEWQNLYNVRIANGASKDDAASYASKNIIPTRLYMNIFNKADDALFTSDGKLASDASIKGTYGEDLDWYDQAVRSGHRQEYNVNVNGASDKADYMFSLGYLDENGYLKDSGFSRISARAAVNVQPKKWIKMGLNLNATHQNYENTNGDGTSSYTNVFMYARGISPIYPVHLHDPQTGNYIFDKYGSKQYDGGSYIDEDGNEILTRNQYKDRHVMWENELNSDKTVRNTINGIAYADFYLPYNFTLTLKGNLNVRNSNEFDYGNATIGDSKGNHGRAGRDDYRYKSYTFQQQLHWSHEFGIHSVDALVGHENYSWSRNYMYGRKANEVFAGNAFLRNFTEITSFYDYNDNYRTESYLGRVRYGYDNRYNAEVSFRRDGSSRFAKEARWGNFWSAGANWVISNEQFMKPYEWVNYLKLRADYGEVGNDAGAGYYGYMALYASTQNANKGAYWISNLPNYDLKWETGQSWGIGIDARLFNRWNLTLEYFDKRNKDLLFDVYNPLSAGATSTSSAVSTVTKNLGTISNRGFEISSDVDVYKTRDWKINVGANITFLKNKIVKLPEQNKDGIIDGTKKIVEGKDRYQFFIYTFEGINTANGYSLYKFDDEKYFFVLNGTTYGNKENESGVANSEIKDDNLNAVTVINGVPYTYTTSYAKKEFHGSAIPTAYGSFNFNVSWKGLSLATLFTYQLGGKVLDYNYQDLVSAGSTAPAAYHKDVLKSWTWDQATSADAINPNGTPIFCSDPVLGEKLSASLNATSQRFLHSASYLILKNINLSYQLPKSWVRKADLEAVSLTIACENLFTKTSLKGMNPQQGFSGLQYNYLVTPRVFSVGLNVKL